MKYESGTHTACSPWRFGGFKITTRERRREPFTSLIHPFFILTYHRSDPACPQWKQCGTPAAVLLGRRPPMQRAAECSYRERIGRHTRVSRSRSVQALPHRRAVKTATFLISACHRHDSSTSKKIKLNFLSSIACSFAEQGLPFHASNVTCFLQHAPPRARGEATVLGQATTSKRVGN